MKNPIKVLWTLGYLDRGMGRGDYGIITKEKQRPGTPEVIVPRIPLDLAEHLIGLHNADLRAKRGK